MRKLTRLMKTAGGCLERTPVGHYQALADEATHVISNGDKKRNKFNSNQYCSVPILSS
jgi:hypothetical protein